MEIYLIRHTKPNIKSNICYGQSDILLNKNFKKDIEILISKLPKNADFIFSSPLIRCKKLANKILEKICNSEVIYQQDKRLMELNFGDWEGKKWDEIDSNILSEWMNDFVNYIVPNGESYQDLQNRSINFWNSEIMPKVLSNNVIIVVTHAGFIRSILSFIQNINLQNSFEIKIEYGSIYKISMDNIITEITSINA